MSQQIIATIASIFIIGLIVLVVEIYLHYKRLNKAKQNTTLSEEELEDCNSIPSNEIINMLGQLEVIEVTFRVAIAENNDFTKPTAEEGLEASKRLKAIYAQILDYRKAKGMWPQKKQ